MGAQILSDLLTSMGTVSPFGGAATREQVEQYERVKAALNEEAKENWENEGWHREQALLLAEQLDYGFTFENLFSTYFQVKRVGAFETVTMRERSGLKVFYTHRGGYIEESTLRTEDFELPRDTLGFHIQEFDDKLQANFADSMEAVASLGQQRLEAEVNRRMFNLLQQAVPSTSPYYVDAAGTGLTKPVLDAALAAVFDAVKPNGTGPVPITIFGRRAAVDAISNFTGYAFEALEEIRLKGRLGTYKAANIVQVVNYTDENGVSYIPDNEVWVFGGTVGLFAMYGDLKTREWLENTVDYRHYRARKDIGGLVHHPEQARRIKIA
jgi:hypothetical protein